MAISFPYRKPGGRGQLSGMGAQSLQMWETQPGRPPIKTHVKPDPDSGHYKLHVRSIPMSWSETVLRHAFMKVGTPTSVYLHPPGDFHLKWGFVEFATFEEARNAVEKLNNNFVLDDIQVSFARDKSENFIDDDNPVIADFLALQAMNAHIPDSMAYDEIPPPVDPRLLTKTVKNDHALSFTCTLEDYVVRPFNENIKYIEEALFRRVLKIAKELPPVGKCVVCSAGSALGCPDCKTLFCSEVCQAKDWPSHSRNCKPSLEKNERGSSSDLQGGGDNRQSMRDMSNGHDSHNTSRPDRSRDNRFSDQSNNRFGNRPNNRFSDGFSNRQENRGPSTNAEDSRRNSPGGGNLFEERKAKMLANKPYQRDRGSNQSGRGNTNNYGDRQGQSAVNGNRPNVDKDGDDWDTPKEKSSESKPFGGISSPAAISVKQEFQPPMTRTYPAPPPVVAKAVKQEFQPPVTKTYPASPAESKAVKPEPDAPEAGSSLLSPGVVEDVSVFFVNGPGLFHVQLIRLCADFSVLSNYLENGTFTEHFTPVLNGVCVANYETSWCRCKVVSLTPLKIFYIDFGNEELKGADELFTLPAAYSSQPPYAIKIKLAEGTPPEFMNKGEMDSFKISPIRKVDDYWEVQIADGLSSAVPPPQATTPTATTAAVPIMSPQATTPTATTAAVPIMPLQATTPTATTAAVPIMPPQATATTAAVPIMPPQATATTAAVPIMPLQATATTAAVPIMPPQATATMAAVPTIQVKPEVSPSPVLAAPRLLPADVFTDVCVKHRSNKGLAVVPLASVEQLDSLMADIQAQVSCAASMALDLGAKCLVKCPDTNMWYRGRITRVSPLTVFLVDNGSSLTSTPDSVKSLPPSLAKNPPFVVQVKAVEGTPELLTESGIFSVKPLYKDTTDNLWVVEVAAIKEEPVTVAQPSSAAPAPDIGSVTSETPAQPSTTRPAISRILPSDQFTTVTITYTEPTEGTPLDVYYVGSNMIWGMLQEMNVEFSRNITDFDPTNLQLGELAIAMYSLAWYRVRVAVLSPLTVHFIDYGNTEPACVGDLKICPNTHKDIPPLVERIKLAPGTNGKYLDLPTESELSVKPVSLLPDGTLIVQVEGEVYSEVESTSAEQAPAVVTTPTSGRGQTPPAPTCTSPSSVSEATGAAVQSVEPQKLVDLLQPNWTATMILTSHDLDTRTSIGTVFCKQVPTSFTFILSEDFATCMETQMDDPSFKATEGDIVGCKVKHEWFRGMMTSRGNVAVLKDDGSVKRCAKIKKLPSQFATIPYLAARLTNLSSSADPNIFNVISGKNEEVSFTVLEVMDSCGRLRVELHGYDEGVVVRGELQAWEYEPLATPDPLVDGDSVTICKVIDSNTVMVSPADDLEVQQQAIQIECSKTPYEEFKSPPKVGDYVTFHLADDDVFCRSRVEKINPENMEYSLFNIDLGTQASATLDRLHPVPTSLRNIPCQATKISLKGVDKVALTAKSQAYISDIVALGKNLIIEQDGQLGSWTLTVQHTGEEVNSKLAELLKVDILPDQNGRLTMASLPDRCLPMDQEVELMVSQTDPLYCQVFDDLLKFSNGLGNEIASHCQTSHAQYNPCTNELCLVKFEDEWYRSLCLRETNTGVSSHFLIDYGNMTDIQTCDIRRMEARFVVVPPLAFACRVKELPAMVPPLLRYRLNELLAVYTKCKTVIESENEGYVVVNIPSVITALKNEGLI